MQHGQLAEQNTGQRKGQEKSLKLLHLTLRPAQKDSATRVNCVFRFRHESARLFRLLVLNQGLDLVENSSLIWLSNTITL